jgi:hypothetical protein
VPKDDASSLLRAAQRVFGPDCIIIYRGTTDHYVTTSSNSPAVTRQIILDLAERME